MNNELMVINDFDTTQRVAKAMAASGYFTDARDAAQAIVKIMAGQEMGLGAFSSMTGIHIIQNKPVLSSNLIATLIKNDPRYDYRIAKLDDTGCTINFFEGNDKVGESIFNKANATAAGLTTGNWIKFPRNMYFARAISNGAKWYTPGVFGGAPVYTPDELGADVDEDGHIIDVTPTFDEVSGDSEPEPKHFEPDDETPTPSDNGQGPETTEPVKAKVEPLFNGKTADARAWLEEKVVDDKVVFGFVADAAVMQGGYGSREHVRNALKGTADFVDSDNRLIEGKPGYDFPVGFDLHFGKNVTGTGGLKVYDWLMSRKVEVE